MSSHETDEDGPAWPPSVDQLRSLVDPNTGDVHLEGESFIGDRAVHPTSIEDDLADLARETGARLSEVGDPPVLWVCRAKPASLGGVICGHPVTRPLRGAGTQQRCCDACGATEKASRDREERELRKAPPRRKAHP